MASLEWEIPTAENDPALDMLQLPSMGPASDEL